MAQLALPAMIIGTAMSAGSKIMQAREQARAAAFEEQQLQIEAQRARTAADQTEARSRMELDAQLGTISAIRASRGVGTDSPTARAITDAIVTEREGDIATERTNYLLRADKASRGAEFAKARKNIAPWIGLMGAGEEVAGGLFKYSRMGK